MSVRSVTERIMDTRAKLESEVDLWVASATANGDAYLLPLSNYWDGATLTMATPATTRTARNLRRAGWARLGLGPTRDVVIIEGPVVEFASDADDALAEAHARAAGFDARRSPGYVFFQLRPQLILAWRNPAEAEAGPIMLNGEWLA
jgi:hypothetical protein